MEAVVKGKFKVFDTTRHVVEPIDLWDARIELPYTHSGAVQVLSLIHI